MGQHQGVHFLVLEYVEGADLYSIVKRDGPMAPAEVAAIGLQTAAALVYAHAQGVIHRDIKPHNILLSTGGVAKLLDMGLARNSDDSGEETEALTSLTQTGMVLGTADYMPPEQAADMTKVDGRSDTYALGATLYFLLAGHPPFPGGDMMSKLNRLANEEPAPIGQLRPDCPRELTAVVETMLAKKPEARYQSTVDVVRALKPLAADRIAGRAVVTHAVQTAAETETKIPNTQTMAVRSFEFSATDTVATSMRRRQKQSPLGKWLIGGAVVMALLIGVGIWAGMSEDEKKGRSDVAGNSGDDSEPVSPDLGNPPSEYRISARTEHVGRVKYVGWSADGNSFATSADDGEIRVWDATKSTKLKWKAVYTGHRVLPTSLVWFPKGPYSDLIASRDELNQLHVWDSRTGKPFYVVGDVEDPVYSLPAIRPDGLEMAFRSTGGTVLWSVERKKRVLVLTTSKHDAMQYSPSGRYLALGSTQGTKIDVWDLENSRLDLPSAEVICQALKIEGKGGHWNRFRFVDDNTMAVTEPTAIKFVDLKTGDIRRTVDIPPIGEKRWGHALSDRGTTLIVWTDESIQKVNLESGQNVERSYPKDPLAYAWPQNVERNSVSPNAERQVVINTYHPAWFPVRLLDFQDDTQFEFGRMKLVGINDFGLHGGRFLSIFRGTLDLDVHGWDLQTGNVWSEFPVISNQHETIRSDGTLLMLSSRSGGGGIEHHVEAFPITGSPLEKQQTFDSFEQIDDFNQGYGAGFIDDGSHVWMLASDRRTLRIWNAQTGKVVRTITPKPEAGPNVFFLDSDNGLWRVRWQLTNDEKDTEYQLESIGAESSTAPVTLRMTQTTNVFVGGFSTDDSRIAIASRETPSRAFVFGTADGKKVAEILVPEDRTHLFNSDRILQLSRSGRYLLLYDQVYDLSAKSPEVKWECPTHSAGYFEARLLGDERHIVVRLVDRYEVWDWQSDSKKVTIFLLPEKQWFVFNHETRCWNNSKFAHRYVEFLHRDKSGIEEWVVPHVYEYRAEWDNDPTKAGLSDLSKR